MRKTFAQPIKKVSIEELETPTSLDTLTVCRLVPIDKKPGMRPIGMGEVLRRIAENVMMMIFKKDITDVAGILQLVTGQESGIFLQIKIQKLFS